MRNLTANEINEKYDVINKDASIIIGGIMQNTIVYTLDDVNKILEKFR